MSKQPKLTKDAISLLLYLEARAVDKDGKFDSKHLNDRDFTILESWLGLGFVRWGRLPLSLCKSSQFWVRLSADAHAEASRQRRLRAERGVERLISALRSECETHVRNKALQLLGSQFGK